MAMAGQTTANSTKFNPYLSATQQDLLLAALTSNKTGTNTAQDTTGVSRRSSGGMQQQQAYSAKGTTSHDLFMSPQQLGLQSGKVSSLDFDDSPYLDYLDGDNSFDMDGELDDDMIGALPGNADGFDKHDKRKSPEEASDNDNGDAKRQEGDDKTAKKPGRKPLTSEPTTKRKAQNRAAQRAFRERKESHLKDLETKVDQLKKTSEADKHEKGLLKAQVDRLQAELKEYKKRMSLNSGGLNRSPSEQPASAVGNRNSNDFQFDFPKFGALSASQILPPSAVNNIIQPKAEKISPSLNMAAQQSYFREHSNGVMAASPSNQTPLSRGQSSASHGSLNRHGSQDSNANRNNALDKISLPQASSNGGMDSFAGLFSPSLLATAPYGTVNNEYGFGSVSARAPVPAPAPAAPAHSDSTDSNGSLNRVFRFNSMSTSGNTASPSTSSLSQWNPNSSCGTSPEPSHPSPPKNASTTTSSDSQSFADTSNANAFSNTAQAPSSWLASQLNGQFDPVLFGDYRESQDNILGDGDFTNSFFNDASAFDFNSPVNFGDMSSPKMPQPAQVQRQAPTQTETCQKLLAMCEKTRDGVDDDYGLPPQVPTDSKLLNCSSIWNQLQNNKDFQEGKFDLDNLCSELRTKAKCSESGAVVPGEAVDAAFKKLSKQDNSTLTKSTLPTLMWDETQFDDALRRLGGGTWAA